jgi:hypothetical protein
MERKATRKAKFPVVMFKTFDLKYLEQQTLYLHEGNWFTCPGENEVRHSAATDKLPRVCMFALLTGLENKTCYQHQGVKEMLELATLL